MIKRLKKLFTHTETSVTPVDPPGRTFKRILTGNYFGCEDIYTDKNIISQKKQKKLDTIHELELIPMFCRYSHVDSKISSVHVTFQKEVLAKKWNMLHITEVSFIINHLDFDEFETMSNLSLKDDFKDLTSYNTEVYEGEERRKSKR